VCAKETGDIDLEYMAMCPLRSCGILSLSSTAISQFTRWK